MRLTMLAMATLMALTGTALAQGAGGGQTRAPGAHGVGGFGGTVGGSPSVTQPGGGGALNTIAPSGIPNGSSRPGVGSGIGGGVGLGNGGLTGQGTGQSIAR